jgi:hypothetical protein
MPRASPSVNTGAGRQLGAIRRPSRERAMRAARLALYRDARRQATGHRVHVRLELRPFVNLAGYRRIVMGTPHAVVA